jgi:multidrug efflux pump subunit AcrA (membrane-fusion protein)
MNTKLSILLAAMLVLMIGCVREPAQIEPSATPVPDKTTTPSPSPVHTGVTILADGIVQTVQPALPLTFGTGGKLLAVHVQAGDQVREGDALARLDDKDAQQNVAAAELALSQAMLQTTSDAQERSIRLAELGITETEMNLASAQANLDKLLNWTPDEEAVALAEANLDAAQGQFYSAAGRDAASQYQVEIAGINVEQAQRGLASAQEHYDAAHDTALDWAPGIEEARKAATTSLQIAQNDVAIAEANLSSAQATATYGNSASAQSNVLSAEQALADLLAGPTVEEIEAARLTVEQMTLALERARINLEAAQDIAQAELNVAQVQLELDASRVTLEYTILRAPMDGIVLSVEAAPGALVGSGSPIVTLLDTTRLEFHTTNLSERDLAQIVPGQTAVVTLKAYPNEPVEAAVVRIGWQAGVPVGDAATFPVMLVLSETDLDIRPGMTGRAEIRSEE